MLAPTFLTYAIVASIVFFACYLAYTTDLIKDQSQLPTARKPYSLSKFQFLWWTTIIASVYVLLFSVGQQTNTLNTTCLVLMGIGISTGILGKITDDRQIEAAKQINMMRHQDEPNNFFLMDLISDEHGPSVHRAQQLLFTLVLGGMFVVKFFSTWQIPEFGQMELSLLGISNATYMAYKQLEKPVPKK
jgi:ABC-type Fe3+-siderophore transport system permease subunit